MKLYIMERLKLPEVLPKAGQYEDRIVMEDVLKKIAICQDDLVRCQFHSVRLDQGGEEVRWNVQQDDGKEINFTALEKELIKRGLSELQAARKLPLENWAVRLFALFVKESEEEASKYVPTPYKPPSTNETPAPLSP